MKLYPDLPVAIFLLAIAACMLGLMAIGSSRGFPNGRLPADRATRWWMAGTLTLGGLYAFFALYDFGDAPVLTGIRRVAVIERLLPVVPVLFGLAALLPERQGTQPGFRWRFLGALAVSFVGFTLISRFLEREQVANQLYLNATLDKPHILGQVIVFALLAAVMEEVCFRGFLQPVVANFAGGRWVGVVAAAAIWALGHAGHLKLPWVLETHLFVFGLLLGWVRERDGLLAAVSLHLTYNGIVLALHIAGLMLA